MIFSNNLERLNIMCRELADYISPGMCMEFEEIAPNVLLECEEGFFLFENMGPVFEVHTIGPPGIGKRTIDAMRMIFTQTHCLEIRTRVPEWNEKASRLSLKSGMRYMHTVYDNKEKEKRKHYGIHIDEWPMVDDECLRMGEEFHEIAPKTHEDCETHDRFAGAAILIAKNDPQKAMKFYNKWALLSGFMPVKIVSEDPLIIDNFDFKFKIDPLEVA